MNDAEVLREMMFLLCACRAAGVAEVVVTPERIDALYRGIAALNRIDESKFYALIDRDLEHYAGKLAKRAFRAAVVDVPDHSSQAKHSGER